jgi:membrane carboxypeptidase/penicillin-binding protein
MESRAVVKNIFAVKLRGRASTITHNCKNPHSDAEKNLVRKSKKPFYPFNSTRYTKNEILELYLIRYTCTVHTGRIAARFFSEIGKNMSLSEQRSVAACEAPSRFSPCQYDLAISVETSFYKSNADTGIIGEDITTFLCKSIPTVGKQGKISVHALTL